MHAPGCGRAHRIDAWATDPVYYRPGGGESVAQMATRVQNRHAEMAHQNTIESAIVICHAGTRRLLANCQNDLLAMAMQAASKEHLLPTARASSSFAENSPAPAVLACTDTHQPPITAMPLAIPGHGHTESKPYRIQAIPNRSHTESKPYYNGSVLVPARMSMRLETGKHEAGTMANVCCPRNGKQVSLSGDKLSLPATVRSAWEGETVPLVSPDTGQNRWRYGTVRGDQVRHPASIR